MDTVAKNYSDAGTLIMEMIYGDEFLSPGAQLKSKALAERAGIASGSRVLDVGCGLGGSAFLLATQYGCQVSGVDLMPSTVREAKRRAVAKRLESKVSFVCADAVCVPYTSGHFDVVWGQDAWCHVEDKAALLQEMERVLVTGGQIVFSDWLLRDPQDPNAAQMLEVTASPTMATSESYQNMLQAKGFAVDVAQDTSDQLVEFYDDVIQRLHQSEENIVSTFNRKVFDIVLNKQQFVYDAAKSGLLGSGVFVARKR